ncbi:hypothetical protein [Pseudoalteromonas luteoviolacea]|uniref:Uncharacterized protein n=1 Tax=Pseudoalteromonas luteoviolacea S4054 TaxID=1129367 RepID=A0A0F6A4Y0_9GAMM|nr:hypothetical protein [Pseudoalteromonas luteoviolacea]AOT09359.1 hypothetical protein S4054249_16550 [Pseudoalteromonas luteoviolacea]AOT14271.1 hypothetical protein S40542_16520 [Pseudoalteromonas luteoviolacea]AOT19187.1 hypothetical protein S4054_16525 [Pseudoalteromonas luteoviolacea]KKE81143.1 hypothetical protein N479_23705 [Pseudoalteromonas luteoviolacea S4054]KZN73460.1 hypothetical protein N481_12120 [Pseudoalteromonas luteoviolacea S4047-1]
MSTQAKTLEQLITELHTTNGELVSANRTLTETVLNKTAEVNSVVSQAKLDIQAAIDNAKSEVDNAKLNFAKSHAETKINYYDRKVHTKASLIENSGLVVDPNDDTKTVWVRVPTGGSWSGFHTYPETNTLTMLHTVAGYAYSPGHSESTQYERDWSITNMEFILTNEAATSEQINDNIAALGIDVAISRTGGWWDGSRVLQIPAMRINDMHPYCSLYVRLVNIVFNSVPNKESKLPQEVLQFGGNCTFAIDSVVNYPHISV